MSTLHLSTLLLVVHLALGGKNKCNGWATEFRCTQITPKEGTTYYDWVCCAQGGERCGFFVSTKGTVKTETRAETHLSSATVHKGTLTYKKWSDCASERVCHFQYFDDPDETLPRAPCDSRHHGEEKSVFGPVERLDEGLGILQVYAADFKPVWLGHGIVTSGVSEKRRKHAEHIDQSAIVFLEPEGERTTTYRWTDVSSKTRRAKAKYKSHCRTPPFEVDGQMINTKTRIMIRKSPTGGHKDDIWLSFAKREKYSTTLYDKSRKEAVREELKSYEDEKPLYSEEDGEFLNEGGFIWKKFEGKSLIIIRLETRGGVAKLAGLKLTVPGKGTFGIPLIDICVGESPDRDGESIIGIADYARDRLLQYDGDELTLRNGIIIYNADHTPMASAAGGALSAVGASDVGRSSARTVHAKVEYHDVDRSDYQNADSYPIPAIYSPYDHYRGYNNRNVIQFVFMVFAVFVFCAACCCSNLGTAISCFLLGKRQMIRESNKNEIEEDVLSP